MSHRTRHELTIEGDEPSIEEVASYLSSNLLLESFHATSHSAEEWLSIIYGSINIVWDNNEDCLKKVSRNWPTTRFTLTGQGEDPGSQWIKYFLNGRMQEESRPRWQSEPFNPARLR